MRPVGSKYLLEEPLGRGATGTVWRARQRETAGAEAAVVGQPGETVAIKVLKEELANDADVVMRFLRERSVLLRLTHPNIVRTRDLVVEGDLLALVMDLVDGPDLHRYLRDNGPFSPVAAALLTAQIADALAASHADGVVHRDLKPANVLLKDDGAGMHPMLTDFGIARLADSPGLTRTHEFVGTPAYVAPESAEGRPQTSAVDIYGAGILLYELVTGHPPFSRRDRAGGAPPPSQRGAPPPDHRARAAVDGHRALSAQGPGPAAQRPEPRPRPADRRRRCRGALQPRPGRRGTGCRRTARARPGARAGARSARCRRPDTGPAEQRGLVRSERGDQRHALHGRTRRPGIRRTVRRRRPDGGHAARTAAPRRDTGARGPAPLAEPAPGRARPQRADPGAVSGPGPGPAAPPSAASAGPRHQQQPPPQQPPARQQQRPQRQDRPPQQYAPQPPQPQQQRYQPPRQQQYAPPQPPPQQPVPRQPREPRQRGANPMRIPGLGCLKGCLFTLVLLFVAGWLIWELTPLQDWVAEGKSYWTAISDAFSTVTDWFSELGGSDPGSGSGSLPGQ